MKATTLIGALATAVWGVATIRTHFELHELGYTLLCAGVTAVFFAATLYSGKARRRTTARRDG